jgi:hypothetical protein
MKRLLRLFPMKWWEMGTLLCVGVLPAIMLFFFLRGRAATQDATPQNWQVPAVEVTQLPMENDSIPVEINRAKAHFKSPSEIDEIIAVVKNNTDKTILATSLQITITTETDGVRSTKISFLTTDSFIHQDIQRANKIKPFLAKDVQVLESAATTYPIGTLIRNVAVKLDYVEFSDGTTAGPDKDGSRIIGQTRSGAAKYKAWLEQQYVNGGRSTSAVLSAVDANDFPSGLELSGYQTHGAIAYKQYLRDAYKLQGADEMMKNFGKPTQ